MMNKVVNMNLNSKDIEKLIKKLETLKKDLSNAPNEIAREAAYDARTFLDLEYADTPYNENIDNIETDVGATNKGWRVSAKGKDVIYAEFGTGDLGQQNPHPEKNEYPLNDYNSGKTIRNANEYSAQHGITSGKYWTYKKNDTIYYTNGIPAGKQVFNTRNYILNEGLDKAAKKVIGDALSKL